MINIELSDSLSDRAVACAHQDNIAAPIIGENMFAASAGNEFPCQTQIAHLATVSQDGTKPPSTSTASMACSDDRIRQQTVARRDVFPGLLIDRVRDVMQEVVVEIVDHLRSNEPWSMFDDFCSPGSWVWG